MPRILIVDDDPDILRVLELNLRLEGYETITTTHGEEALKVTRDDKPDLILLDIILPDVSGLDICKAIRSDHQTRHIPIILISARGEIDDQVQGWELGAMDYIQKPVNLATLVERIEALLRRAEGLPPREEPEEPIHHRTRLALAGAGKEGAYLLKFLWGDPRVQIMAMADKDPDAEGLQLAENLSINTTRNLAELFQIPDLELVIATRYAGVLSLMREDESVEIIGERTLQFLLNLVNDREERIRKERNLTQTLALKVNELSTIGSLVRSFASNLDLATNVRSVVEMVRPVMRATACALIFCDSNNSELTLAAYCGPDGYIADTVLVPAERELALAAMNAQQVINIPDLQQQPDLSTRDFGNRGQFRGFLGAPLRVRDNVFGALCLFNTQPSSYHDNEITLLTTLADEVAISLDNARTYQDLNLLYQGFITAFSEAADARDAYSHRHSVAVGALCSRMARQLGWPDEQVALMEKAGCLHDLGKIGIADSILKKPGALSAEEKEIIASHPVIGARIVSQVNFKDFQSIAPIIRHQYERWDGSGTPDRLAGDVIPIGARILGLADAFDALMSKRSYRDAFDMEKSISILKAESGRQFDPELVKLIEILKNEDPDFFEPWIARLIISA